METPSRRSNRALASMPRRRLCAAVAALFGIVGIVGIVGIACLAGRAIESAAALAAPAAPRAVDPGPVGGPPSDAIVLFDGSADLSRWTHASGADAKWPVEDGALVASGAGGRMGGDLWTRDKFGDVQLHFEWMTPLEADKQGESRGNSGVKLHGVYEIQILDSVGHSGGNAGGQAGAVYKQHPPLVNACRKPGEWQSFDIVFRASRFDDSGKLLKEGRFTVFQNGVLVQDNAPFSRRTNSGEAPPKELRQPFFLQWHGSAVKYRNIWVRELEPRAGD